MKKNLLIVFLVLATVTLFVACDDSTNKGFWQKTEPICTGSLSFKNIYSSYTDVYHQDFNNKIKNIEILYFKNQSSASKGRRNLPENKIELYEDENCSKTSGFYFMFEDCEYDPVTNTVTSILGITDSSNLLWGGYCLDTHIAKLEQTSVTFTEGSVDYTGLLNRSLNFYFGNITLEVNKTFVFDIPVDE